MLNLRFCQKGSGTVRRYSAQLNCIQEISCTNTKRQTSTLNTYIEFLEQMQNHYYKKGHRIYLIQDNASYHKKPETYDWFTANRKYIEVFNLPPYCPELNSTERIWHYTRMQATHNRYYDTKEDLCNALFLTFSTIQKTPNLINALLTPFF